MSLASKFREPFSGLSHLVGAGLSVAALVVLLTDGAHDTWRKFSFAVYGGSLVVLYASSSLYHLLSVSDAAIERLRRLDHAGIFILIAGTYTPVCLVPLRGAWGYGLLAAVWGIAIPGIIMEIIWKHAPDWVDFVLYIVMGWMAMIAIGPISHVISGVALRWLLAGGVCYTVGAVVYATGRPRLWPGRFGSHDLWHIFVLGGSAAHFMMMLTFATR